VGAHASRPSERRLAAQALQTLISAMLETGETANSRAISIVAIPRDRVGLLIEITHSFPANESVAANGSGSTPRG
jgi:hypothetical protein